MASSAPASGDQGSGGSQEQQGAAGLPGRRNRATYSGGRDVVVLAIAVAIFLVLSLKNITLPGLYYDEALDVVPAMQLLQGTPVELVRNAGLTIAGHTFPLMVMDYVGTVNTYLALPLFAVLGVNVTSVRLLPILLAVLSMLLGYRLAAQLFDWRVAAFSTLLAATDPSFVFFSRMGIHVTSVMTVFALGSLLALLRWSKSGHDRWLGLCGLLLGLGLWAKVLFLWWIVALAIAWIVWWGADRRSRAPSDGQREERPWGGVPGVHGIVILVAGIVVGSTPLWLYNLMSGGTLTSFGRNAVVTDQGVSNLNVIANVAAAIDSFRVLLDGRYFWFLGKQLANPLNVIAFAAAALGGLLLLRWRRQWRAGFALILVLIIVVVAESVFTVSGIWATHLYILLPLPQIIVAVAVVALADNLAKKRRWLQVGLIGLALAGGMLANVRVDRAYYAELERSRGLSRFSDAIYKLADWLDQGHYATVYAVDWGIQKNVQLLTQGRVNPVEIYSFPGEAPEAFVQRLEKAFADPSAVFILHSKEDTVYEMYPAFQATADRLGYTVKIIDATRDNSGAPVHVMWVAEKK